MAQSEAPPLSPWPLLLRGFTVLEFCDLCGKGLISKQYVRIITKTILLKYLRKSFRCRGQKRSLLHLLWLKLIKFRSARSKQRSLKRERLCKQGGIVLTVCDEALFACPPLCASDTGPELGWRPRAATPPRSRLGTRRFPSLLAARLALHAERRLLCGGSDE